MTSAPDRGFDALDPYAHEAAELLRLLGNASRLQLLYQLAKGEHSVGQLERSLDIRQPALSQQLAELRKAGIVRTRRESRSVFYALDDARVPALLDMLRVILRGGAVQAPSRSAQPETDNADAPNTSSTGDTARFARLSK
jgi:ArsR family transcriptional regulator